MNAVIIGFPDKVSGATLAFQAVVYLSLEGRIEAMCKTGWYVPEAAQTLAECEELSMEDMNCALTDNEEMFIALVEAYYYGQFN